MNPREERRQENSLKEIRRHDTYFLRLKLFRPNTRHDTYFLCLRTACSNWTRRGNQRQSQLLAQSIVFLKSAPSGQPQFLFSEGRDHKASDPLRSIASSSVYIGATAPCHSPSCTVSSQRTCREAPGVIVTCERSAAHAAETGTRKAR